ADLRFADLRFADLRFADLTSANLTSANLTSADLRSADLTSANLRFADLKNLPQDYINQCSRDILFILEHTKNEIPYLREKLIKGEVDGTQYEGDCACLIGSLGKADGGTDKICSTIPFYEKGLHNYGEQWFWQIKKGDTPKNNEFAAHALKLIEMVIGPEKKTKKKK
ncbi:MAG TPA: pentapeptide repeat-containing protein, partial [Rhabdochlamydiaceae bacterium]